MSEQTLGAIIAVLMVIVVMGVAVRITWKRWRGKRREKAAELRQQACDAQRDVENTGDDVQSASARAQQAVEDASRAEEDARWAKQEAIRLEKQAQRQLKKVGDSQRALEEKQRAYKEAKERQADLERRADRVDPDRKTNRHGRSGNDSSAAKKWVSPVAAAQDAPSAPTPVIPHRDSIE